MAPRRGRQPGLQRPPPDSLVRSQLDKVLASELFLRSERLSGFLRFVVEETLNGRGETLKESVLAHELYGKEADFDGATNPIVRVDARRLRDKLREYYAYQTGDPVVIALPKGSYVPTFDRAADTAPAPDIQFQAVEPMSVDAAFHQPVPGHRCADVGTIPIVGLAWRDACVGSGGVVRRRLRSALPEHPAVDRTARADHAGGPAVSEPDRRSRTAVPLRRADRGDDRHPGPRRLVATGSHRAHVGDAL